MQTLTISSGRPLRGEIRVPGDKSISHRALLLGALARGASRATGFLPSDDCLSTIACLERLGIGVERPEPTTIIVNGSGLRGLSEPADILDCGNSGTTMRLIAGILAGQPFYSVLTGDHSLRSRPMKRIAEPLRSMGATVTGRSGGAFAPLTIVGGHLHGIHYALPIASAQVKSCLILAALFADGPSEITEPSASRDHTEQMLAAQGAEIRSTAATTELAVPDGRKPVTIRVGPAVTPLAPLDVAIPGDISSAAFFLVAATVAYRSRLVMRDVGVNATRTGILDAMKMMGATVNMTNIRRSGGEPIADLEARTSDLRGVELGGALIPRLIDELPVIAVAATQAHGATVVRNAEELRVKESDRIATVVRELRKLGARIEERPDGFEVLGPSPLHGSVVDARGDHRLAMALAVAALCAHGETTILGAESINVSFPGFQRTLAICRGELT